MSEKVVILVTCSSEDEAVEIGRALVSRRLIACANLVRGVRSLFRWEGEVCEEAEVLMILKTTRARVSDVVAEVKRLHSYSVPEVIALPIVAGSEAYLNWVDTETEGEAARREE